MLIAAHYSAILLIYFTIAPAKITHKKKRSG